MKRMNLFEMDQKHHILVRNQMKALKSKLVLVCGLQYFYFSFFLAKSFNAWYLLKGHTYFNKFAAFNCWFVSVGMPSVDSRS